jgi:hypothetical protein
MYLTYNEIKKLDNRIKVCFLTAGEIYYGIYTDFEQKKEDRMTDRQTDRL